VTDAPAGGLERARQELAAAELLAGHGFNAQAVSRAYFAAFYAAETALLALGETRAKHSGVIAAFAQLLVRDRQLDEAAGRLLRPSSSAAARPTTNWLPCLRRRPPAPSLTPGGSSKPSNGG
jgi:uncharacterized protein (UPF0332 family)